MTAILDKESCARAYVEYLNLLSIIARKHRLTARDFMVSGIGFCNAMVDAKMDMEILDHRRNFDDGISRGKIAGIIVFRLCRNLVSFPTPQAKENPIALKIPILTALAFGLFLIDVNPAQLDEFILRELKYYVAKRHINQEALGICFDTLFTMRHA